MCFFLGGGCAFGVFFAFRASARFSPFFFRRHTTPKRRIPALATTTSPQAPCQVHALGRRANARGWELLSQQGRRSFPCRRRRGRRGRWFRLGIGRRLELRRLWNADCPRRHRFGGEAWNGHERRAWRRLGVRHGRRRLLLGGRHRRRRGRLFALAAHTPSDGAAPTVGAAVVCSTVACDRRRTPLGQR